MSLLRREVLQTLLYYDIWRYPLTREELLAFLPVPCQSPEEFRSVLDQLVAEGDVGEDRGYFFVPGPADDPAGRRTERERHARRLWRAARISMHVIKRFPFVRGVFVSGDLSKNATDPKSDVDFLILTVPGRLWIVRTLLTVFKKTVLLNSRKFFCVNSLAATDNLRIEERDIYHATEVAQLKPLYNFPLFERYLKANRWIRGFFPNFDLAALRLPHASSRPSLLQRLLEAPFALIPSDRLDTYLLHSMERVWTRRYPQFDEATRKQIFRCTKGESRAYVGNFQEKILALYDAKLRAHGVSD